MYLNAIAHYLPKRQVTNAYFESITDTTDEWLVSRTGIRERRRAQTGENTNTMALEAVKLLVAKLPFEAQTIDLLVSGTYTPYDTIATPAHVVQQYLDISDIPTVTVSTACSSLLNAVELVEGYFAMGKAARAIVVVVDHNSYYNEDTNRISGHLWGDGAAALSISKQPIGENNIKIKEVITAGAANIGKGPEGVRLIPANGKAGIAMNHGRDVFTHACQYMTQVSNKLLVNNGYQIEDLTYFIPHQANDRISQNVAGRLGLKPEQIISNIQYLGNTGCAGCAIGLSENWHQFKPGDKMVVTVFGGGYSYGGMLLEAE